MAYQAFWDIPPARVILIAVGVTVVFLGTAYWLYHPDQATPSMYSAKVADALINGAIGGILVVSIRAMFGLPQFLERLTGIANLIVLGFLIYLIAFVVTAGFLVLAHCLYQYTSPYLNKVADALITGAIGGLLLAILRAMFGLPKLQARTGVVGANGG